MLNINDNLHLFFLPFLSTFYLFVSRRPYARSFFADSTTAGRFVFFFFFFRIAYVSYVNSAYLHIHMHTVYIHEIHGTSRFVDERREPYATAIALARSNYHDKRTICKIPRFAGRMPIVRDIVFLLQSRYCTSSLVF